MHSCATGLVGVAGEVGHCRVVALAPVTAGLCVYRLEGELTARPTRFSVQIGADLHVAPEAGSGAEVLERSFWQFTNHACEPNAVIRGQDVIAIRDIAPWEDVTFHYGTTEWEMAEPFACHCGSARCAGTIRGAKFLSAADRERLTPLLAPHILDYLSLMP